MPGLKHGFGVLEYDVLPGLAGSNLYDTVLYGGHPKPQYAVRRACLS